MRGAIGARRAFVQIAGLAQLAAVGEVAVCTGAIRYAAAFKRTNATGSRANAGRAQLRIARNAHQIGWVLVHSCFAVASGSPLTILATRSTVG